MSAKKLKKAKKAKKAKELQMPVSYPEDSAGSIMSGEYTALSGDISIAEAFKQLRQSDEIFENIYYCYVVNEKNTLEGTISVREIFASPEDALVREVMEDSPVYVEPELDQEEVVKVFDRYDYLAIPVVDKKMRLLGVITIDDVLDVMQEEATEDLTKMASVQPDKTPYLETSVLRHARSRIIWLLILTFSGMLNEGILSNFDHVFIAIPVLVSYIPMLTDTGGNAGSQSSSIIIRSMALGEISTSEGLPVVFKELAIGFVVGLAMGAVNLLRIVYFEGQSFPVALTVSLTLLGIAMVSKMLGAALPLLADRFNVDSAVMAGPLIATLSDGVSILIYFSLAQLILM